MEKKIKRMFNLSENDKVNEYSYLFIFTVIFFVIAVISFILSIIVDFRIILISVLFTILAIIFVNKIR